MKYVQLQSPHEGLALEEGKSKFPVACVDTCTAHVQAPLLVTRLTSSSDRHLFRTITHTLLLAYVTNIPFLRQRVEISSPAAMAGKASPKNDSAPSAIN